MKSYPRQSSLILAGISIASILTSHSLRAQTLTDLGDLGGGSSYANALNDSGEVVGYSTTATGSDDAFLYSNGTISDLGTLPGDTDSAATGINDSGQIVGFSGTNSNDEVDYERQTGGSVGSSTAFLYSGGMMTNLAPSVGGSSSAATGINNSGQVVGYATTTTVSSPFLYSGGSVTNIPSSGNSPATGINNSGQAVGFFFYENQNLQVAGYEAFLYSGGTVTGLGFLNSEQFGRNVTDYAFGINSLGQVVGNAGIPGENHAILFSGGTVTDLGTLGGVNPASYASGINDAGEIVGYSGTVFGSQNLQAFIYSSGTMENLNTLYASLLVSGTTSQAGFVSLEDATAINNAGEIVGYGEYWNGTTDQTEAFLIAPEPSIYAMVVLGILSLFGLGRFRKLVG